MIRAHWRKVGKAAGIADIDPVQVVCIFIKAVIA
jgi:hypothetical protein